MHKYLSCIHVQWIKTFTVHINPFGKIALKLAMSYEFMYFTVSYLRLNVPSFPLSWVYPPSVSPCCRPPPSHHPWLEDLPPSWAPTYRPTWKFKIQFYKYTGTFIYEYMHKLKACVLETNAQNRYIHLRVHVHTLSLCFGDKYTKQVHSFTSTCTYFKLVLWRQMHKTGTFIYHKYCKLVLVSFELIIGKYSIYIHYMD